MKKYSLMLAFVSAFMSYEAQAMRAELSSVIPVLSWLSLKLGYEFDLSAKTCAAIVATGVVLKAGYDWSWHSDYVRQSEQEYRQFVNYVSLHNIISLKDPALSDFFKRIDLDCYLRYESWLRNSYDSWLKPWNWNAGQKAAYKKMEILSMIALHEPMMNIEASKLDQKLVDHARKCCSAVSKYPVVYYGNQIEAHLTALSAGFPIKHSGIQTMLAELEKELLRLKYALRGTKDYIEEVQIMKIHELLEKAANNR